MVELATVIDGQKLQSVRGEEGGRKRRGDREIGVCVCVCVCV